jgi:NAD(P)-dependent dehydrogenase (short-subunit alcohol dehydrogenase family)
LKKYLLISGATSGIGLAVAKQALDKGYHIIGCCYPDIDHGAILKQYRPAQVSLVITDVSSEDSITATFKQVADLVGDHGLKGLINCAGVALLCPAEHLTVTEFRHTITINLIGTFAMCRLALPLLRKAEGSIVNISSDGGVLAMPTGSAYCASKFGVEAFSDALRGEVKAQGVDVIVIEPGNIDTPLWDSFHAPLKKKYVDLNEEHKRLYGGYFEGLLNMGRQGIPVGRVADVILGALEARRKKARYLVGPDARVSWLVARLPAGMRDRLANRIIKSYVEKSEQARRKSGC